MNRTNIMKHTVKDSVFTNLFQDTKYLIQLYRALHPEDTTVTEKDIENVTINNILTDKIYNDLGFKIGNKLLILVEAQSTWTENILVRGLMYLVQTYQEYIDATNQNVYSSRIIKLPKPELYVIYTGDKEIADEYISLNELFWNNDKTSALDVKVRIITDSRKGDILNQYITFAKICDEQRKIYGRTADAINEIIRICMDNNVLKEYLASKEREVKNIMIALFDNEEVMKSFWKSELHAEKEEGRTEGLLTAIKNLIINADKTAAEAMALLGIPETDREKYTEMLNMSYS